MRTPQQALRDALPAIQAAAEGKAIEYDNGQGVWKSVHDISCWDFADPYTIWRVKPEPKRTLRPWKPEEVPVGAIVKTAQSEYHHRWIIIAVGLCGITTCGGTTTLIQDMKHFAESCEHSIDPIGTPDSKRTWLPCGVWEEEA